MRTLRLYAIAVDALRDVFGADTDLADRLRGVARERFAVDAPPPPSALRKIGPLFRRHQATEVDPRRPLRGDVDALLTGAHIEPDRLPQCWQVVMAWLDDLAVAEVAVGFVDVDDAEFDLARAGLPSEYSLRHLAGRDLGIPLRPLPTQVVGYAKHGHVVETFHELRAVPLGQLQDSTRRAVEPALRLLEAAAGAGTDVVVVEQV